ncbi:hypothetical protein [Leptolyngbya ohadii]|uniref:hypothetical protein n=1 Tax=Leptolyngbya ohadii TaxID=1962290 RepID=UPI0019D491B1|nr:hypothetical protein [Leptolyngbya ohadii]
MPDWMRGLWRRLSIETEDGQRDTKTQVFYLQTSLCFGDLRIPGDRPDIDHSSFLSLTQAEALSLSQQQGFAGVVQFEWGNPHRCQWVRQIDYQPSQPVRDIGWLYWQDDLLIEDGIDQVYREEWQKVDDGQGDYTALVLAADLSSPGATWQASLVIAGDYFVYSQNRSFPLPPNGSLTDCLTHAPAQEKQQDYLNCEISFGRCRSGRVPWEIQRSTIPWREGSALWSIKDLAIDLEKQRVLQTVDRGDTSKNQQEIREWKIWEWGTGDAFQG